MCNHILNFLVTADNTNDGSVLHWDIALQQLSNAVFMQRNYHKLFVPRSNNMMVQLTGLDEKACLTNLQVQNSYALNFIYYLDVCINSNNKIK